MAKNNIISYVEQEFIDAAGDERASLREEKCSKKIIDTDYLM